MIVYRHARLRGLELWNGVAGHATLYQLRESKRDYFGGLRDFLLRLHRGGAESADPCDTLDLARAAGFRRLVLCGGEAGHPLLVQAMGETSLPFAVEIGETGPYAASAGAQNIFDEMRWRSGVALDLGQSRLKVISRSCRHVLPRDAAALPFGARSLDPEVAIGRLRAMIRAGLDRIDGPDGVVLGLPVALDNAGIARPATYPGLFGPVEPIFAELFPMPWVVANDAVLTARGYPPRGGEKTLVVTLGFGIGGALWEP